MRFKEDLFVRDMIMISLFIVITFANAFFIHNFHIDGENLFLLLLAGFITTMLEVLIIVLILMIIKDRWFE